jgi:ribosomal protein L11 methyltransferase
MIRLAVRCRPEHAELVISELMVLAPNGFEEEQGDGYVELAIYGAEGELPELGRLEAVAGEGAVEVEATEVPDDWADRWHDFHQPILIGERVWVRPSWTQPRSGALDVVIDPGRAFGTGAHATTRMCIELLIELAADGAGGALLDLGTGSGVLAIAAAKLGWTPVRGCDHTETALQAAHRNAQANEVELELERVNLRQSLPALAETMTANLTAPLLFELAAGLEGGELPRTLVCSGLLASEADRVSAALAAAGLGERRRLADGDWAALVVAR